ncbi:chemotaxis protein CheX [Candidatus Sumerlaeota bacterium]|nr:chemotaxis protein CheX [Candidatus Sumerlaeota bacterium]
MDLDLPKLLIDSVAEVFEVMSFLDVNCLPPATQSREFRGLGLAASVALAGDISGVLAVHCTEDFACDCAKAMASVEGSPSPAQIADTMGELLNMIAGSLKRRVSSRAGLFEISLPSVLVSRGHSILYRGGKERFPRLLIPFSIDNSVRFYVELLHHKR